MRRGGITGPSLYTVWANARRPSRTETADRGAIGRDDPASFQITVVTGMMISRGRAAGPGRCADERKSQVIVELVGRPRMAKRLRAAIGGRLQSPRRDSAAS